MTDEEKLKEITDLSIIYRGTILNECIFLEKSMDDFIAKDITFDEEIQVRIFQILLDRMTFEGKITAMTGIMDDAQDKAGFVKTNTKGYPHKDLVKRLRMIKDERNSFAHYAAFLLPKVVAAYPKVGFINFRDKAKVEWYDQERIDKSLKLIRETTVEINEMVINMQTLDLKHENGKIRQPTYKL